MMNWLRRHIGGPCWCIGCPRRGEFRWTFTEHPAAEGFVCGPCRERLIHGSAELNALRQAIEDQLAEMKARR